VIQPRTPGRAIEQAWVAIRKSVVRRRVQAVAAGESGASAVDFDEAGLDVGAIVCEVAAPIQPGSPQLKRLREALQQAGYADIVVDRLSASDPALRTRSARIIGALVMEDAIPWLAPLLADGDQHVREVAARALGRIGGSRSADALVRAIQQSGPKRTLINELARGAPDLYLESALMGPRANVRAAVCVAAGVRRRRASVAPLLVLLASGTRRERAASAKALGWIGVGSAVPALIGALMDRDSRVRLNASKALAAIDARSRRPKPASVLSVNFRSTLQQSRGLVEGAAPRPGGRER
jgi:HEAT repeat protein